MKKKPRGKPENLKSWKPGQSGNPGGRPKLPEDVKAIRTMDKVEFSRTLHKFLHMDRPELEAYLAGPGVPMLHEFIGSIVLQGTEHADGNRFEMLLRRYIGPVTEEVQVGLPKPRVIEYPDGATEVMSLEKEEGVE